MTQDETAKTFAVGNVVQLRSGGPEMTVSKIDTDTGMVECAWFGPDHQKHPLYNAFRADLLFKIKAKNA